MDDKIIEKMLKEEKKKIQDIIKRAENGEEDIYEDLNERVTIEEYEEIFEDLGFNVDFADENSFDRWWKCTKDNIELTISSNSYFGSDKIYN